MSKYEDKVALLLSQSGYKFEREKTFDDLKNGRYRFDFYVKAAIPFLIEVDGEQHFDSNSKFYKTKSEFKKAQEHDRRKNSYCLANNLLLYRIPYWEISKLQVAADCIQNKFLVHSKWHNDELLIPKI